MRSDTPGLSYWDARAPEVLTRIEATWNLGQPPEMGQGPWLYATAKGKTIAAQHRR